MAVAAILFFTDFAQAREWAIVGPRALGMGGANVAVANDATASYWNPGAYGFFNSPNGGDYGNRKWSAVINGGLGAQVHEDLGAQIDNLVNLNYSQFDLNATMPAASVADYIQLINGIKTFKDNENRAITVLGNAGVNVQVSHYGAGAYGFADISARGDIDLNNIAPVPAGTPFTLANFTDPVNYGCNPAALCTGSGAAYFGADYAGLQAHLAGLGWTNTEATNFLDAVGYGLTNAPAGTTLPSQAELVDMVKVVADVGNQVVVSGGGSFADNASVLVFTGLAIYEFPITYGRAINDSISIGGNIKYMKGRSFNTAVLVFDTEFDDALDTAKDDYLESSNFGIDLGVLYRFGNDLRFGVVGRNLNSPEFDMPSLTGGQVGKVSEDPQIRAGIAYKPFKSLLLAVDIDLTENETTVSDNYKSRNIGAGLEFDVLRFLQLRAGAYKNLSESDIGMVYTAGIGFNLWAVNMDFGASISNDNTTVDGEDVPEEIRAEFAFSTLW